MPKRLFASALHLIFLCSFLQAQSDTLSIHHPAHPDRAEYRRDSLETEQDILRFFRYYWTNQFDSLMLVASSMKQRASTWKEGDDYFSGIYYYGEASYGQVRCMQGYYTDGLPQFISGLERMSNYIQNDDISFYVSSKYIALGRIFESLGYFEKALQAYLEADRLQTKLVDKGLLAPHWLAFKANYLADVYNKLEQFAEAERLFQKAARIFEETGVGLRYDRYHSDLLALYVKTGANQQARLLRDSVETFLAAHSGDRQIAWRVFMHHKTLADAYYEVDSLSAAERQYKEVLKVAEQYPMVVEEQEANAVPFSYYQLARIYLRTGRIASAGTALEQARAAWLKDHPREGEFWTRLLLFDAQCRLQQQQAAAALSLFNEVLSKYYPSWTPNRTGQLEPVEQWPLSPWIMQALRGRLEVLAHQLHDETDKPGLSSVLAAAELAQQYLEYMIQTYSTDYTKAKIFAENRSVYAIPVRLLSQQYEATHNPQNLQHLFLVFEKSKALQLLSTVKGKQLQSAYSIPDTLLAKERRLRQEIAFYKKQLAASFRTGQDSAALRMYYQDELARLLQADRDLQQLFRDQYANYYRLKYDLSVITLPELQASLAPNKGVLSYFWGTDQIYVLSITGQQVDSWSIALDSMLVAKMDQFTHFVRTPPRTETPRQELMRFTLQGYSLYQSLLGPAVAQHPRIQSWMLFPDGQLWYLPWAALPTRPSTATTSFRELPYLMLRFALQQEYSATLMLEDFPRPSQTYAYLGVAPEYDPQAMALTNSAADLLQMQRAFREGFREGYVPLRFNSLEIGHAGQQYPSGVQLIGPQATETAFKSYAGDSRILHLAMHALTNDVDPMLSHLVFSQVDDSLDNGLLYAYEIYNMHLPVELAILSACNTGAGTILDGQGVMSLARAFKYAGCRDVMMTLWPANDHSTATFMSHFFDWLQSDADKAAALQGAMQSYLEEQPNESLTHPFYWSGFTLIGSGNALGSSLLNEWWNLPLLLSLCLMILYLIRTAVKRQRSIN